MLFLDTGDRLGDTYVTAGAGCTDSYYKSAAFDFALILHGTIPDNGKLSPLAI